MRDKPESASEYLRRYPRLCSAVIAYSLGYCTPLSAANIVKDAHERKENWCEWIFSCYNRDPLPAVRNAFNTRHTLKGYMTDYRLARKIVDHTLNTGDSPLFASWF